VGSVSRKKEKRRGGGFSLVESSPPDGPSSSHDIAFQISFLTFAWGEGSNISKGRGKKRRGKDPCAWLPLSPSPPRQRSARAPWNASIWSILGKRFRSAVNVDRILTESGFWATNYGTLPAEGVT
jgi:hypothetical protein